MITEMDRIKMIIAEGAKKGLVLSKFIDLQIDDFKQSDTFKEMVEGSKYYKNQGDIEYKQRIIIAENGAEQVAPHAKNYKLKHPIIYKMINQKAGYLLRKKPTIKQVLAKNEKEDEEYKDLTNELGSRINEYIDRLSSYMKANNRVYQDHKATIINWYLNDQAKNINDNTTRKMNYDIGESLWRT